jgi:tetratricopeptide (TPR) repeat protein
VGQAEGVLTLVGGIRYFWVTRGAWREGRRWVEPALERTSGKRSLARAKALGAAGMFAYPLGDLEAAKAHAEESLAEFREFGSTAEIGRPVGGLAAKLAALGDLEGAGNLFEEAAVHLRVGGDRFNLAVALGNLADLATRRGDYASAESLLEEALALYRKLGREHGVQYSLYNLAFLQYQNGRDDEAVSTASESLLFSHRLGDARFAMLSLSLLGSLAVRQGDRRQAARLLGAAETKRVRLGLALSGTPEGELHEKSINELRVTLGVRAFNDAFAEGGSRTLDETVASVLEQPAAAGPPA